MSLHKRILDDLATAMKQKDAQRLSTLRMIKAAFIHAAKAGGATSDELTDEQVVDLLAKEAKKRKEAAAAFHQAQREELAQNEEQELAIIAEYLPAELSDDEIRAVVNEVAAELGRENFGAVMGKAMQQLKGRADGNRVKTIVNDILSS